jgi:Leucine-rich repeat (LRR) protein
MKKLYSNPILILLLFFLSGISINTKAQYADESDSLILVDFQKAMIEKGWPQFWDTSQNISNWRGVGISSTTGKVTEVDLNRNWFSSSFTSDSLPSCIAKLKSLDKFTELVFNNWGTKYLSEGIGDLSNLEYLNLGYNNITEVPPSLGKLTNLQYLFLHSNQLTDLPDELSSLTNLTDLTISSNETLTKLPDVVTKLSSITDLDIGYCSITTLPVEIKNLQNLEELSVDHCKLTSLPDEIGELPTLETLFLIKNELSTLPESMGDLKNLRSLNISINNLTELPESFNSLDSLKSIQFYSNQLDSFPCCLAELPKLQYIKGEKNNMKGSVPPEIFEKKNLNLYLDNNDLSGKLEIQSNKIPKYLYVTNNRFTLKDIKEHYNEFDSDPYNPYKPPTYIKFQPQQNIGTFRTLKPAAGDDIGLGVDNYEPTEGCEITWYRADRLNGTGTAVATAADDTLNIEDFDPDTDAGVYYCVVTHPDLEDLSLTSNPICLVGDTDAAPNISASDVLFRCGNDAMLYLTISDDYTRVKDMIFDIPGTTEHFILRPDSVTNYPNNRYIFPKEGVLAAVDTVKISVTDGGGNTSSTEVIIKMVTAENQPPQINVPVIYMSLINNADLSCIPESANCADIYVFVAETYLDNYVTDDNTSSGNLTFSAVIDSIDGSLSDSDPGISIYETNMGVYVYSKSDVTVYVSLTVSDDEGGTTTKQILLKGIGMSQSADDPNDPPEIGPIPEQVIEKGTTAFPPLNLKDYITDDYLPFDELDITLSPNSVTSKIQKDSMLYVSPLYPDSVYSGSLVLAVMEKRNSLNENIAEINYRVIDRNLSVLFTVTASGTPVKDALITINGSNYLTDCSGHATVSLPSAGSYSYTVDDSYGNTDYQKATGTVTITNTGITESVQLIPAQPTAINDEPQATEAPCIYPNPVSSILSIDMPTDMEVDVIELYNITGSKVCTKCAAGQSSVQIDMGGYPDGLYFIRWLQKGKVAFCGKVIRGLP